MRTVMAMMVVLATAGGAQEKKAPTVFEVSKVGKDKSTLLEIFHVVYPPKPAPKVKDLGPKPNRFPYGTVHWVWKVGNKVAPKKYVAHADVGEFPDWKRVRAILHLRSEPEGGYGYGEEIIAPMLKTDKTEEYLLTYRVYEEPEDNSAAGDKWEEEKDKQTDEILRAEVRAEKEEKKNRAEFIKRLKAGEVISVTLVDEKGKATDYHVKW